jgi:hypothetical protein
MNKRIRIVINGADLGLEHSAKMLRECKIEKPDLRVCTHPHYVLEFGETDIRGLKLIETLNSYKIIYEKIVWVEYESKDLEDAPMLWLRNAGKTKGNPQLYSEYDNATACPHCGTGTRLIGTLRIKANELSRKSPVQQCHTGEVLLSESLVHVVCDEIGAVVPCLRLVENSTSGRLLPWRCVVPEYILPPYATETSGVQQYKPCQICKRDGYYGNLKEPFQPVYRLDDFENVQTWPRQRSALPPDFAYSWEYYGKSSLNLNNQPYKTVCYAQPLVIISKRIMKIMIKHKVREFDFVPVAINHICD